MGKRSKRSKKSSAPPWDEQAASLIRAIGTKLAAEWIKDLVDEWLGNRDRFL
jgi:hypothetical protein